MFFGLYEGCLLFGFLFIIMVILCGSFFDAVLENIFTADFLKEFTYSATSMIIGVLTFGSAGLLLTKHTAFSGGMIIFFSAVASLILSVTLYFLYMKLMRKITILPLEELLGREGAVVTPIPCDGYGEVLIKIEGATSKQIAASRDKVDIETDRKVVVSLVHNGAVYVSVIKNI